MVFSRVSLALPLPVCPLFLGIFAFLRGENFAVREIILMLSSCWWLGSSRMSCSLPAMKIGS